VRRARAEAEVREARARAESLARFPEENPNPVLRLDDSGSVLYANAAARSALAPLGAEPGRRAPEPLLRGVANAFAEGRWLSAEIPAGERIFLVTFVPVGREANVYATDITQRKRAEQQAERSREALRRLLDTSLEVVGEQSLERLLGVVAEAALDLTHARIATFGHGYVNGRFAIGASARVEGAPPCPVDGELSMRNGGVYLDLVEGRETVRLGDAELRAHARWWGLPDGHVPLRGLLGVRLDDADGRIAGMLLVTDRREGEFTSEDESLLRHLGAIASLALRHVKARVGLEEADRRKDEFLAMLSHELRNPLAPIRNSLYVLERALPGSDQARRAQAVIERQVSHLTRLVDDLLDVTRISRGKLQLAAGPVDLAELVRAAVEDHRPIFAHGGVALDLVLPGGALVVSGDATRLAQVVGNLLQNAAKFTGRGGLATVRVGADSATATVTVRDSGVGIDREMLPRLFEPFAQADATLDRSRGGLGLGLALVKSVVELHGGGVRARSDGPGTGAEFSFWLPLLAAQRGDAAARPAAARPLGRRVLVVEDNPDAAETLREVLELGGHDVVVAVDGRTALEKARRLLPDLVLCDIGLPEMDGYAVARALRADPVLRSVRLVALTGYAMPDDHARARQAGFDEHLAKPAGLDQLEGILQRAPSRAGRDGGG
jgi:signal transduction histidine kinase/ActR/RegA family two-component response regulator